MKLFFVYWTVFLLFSPTPIVVASSSAAGQETLIGLVGKDFCMLGADTSVSRSIALQHFQMDKIYVLSPPHDSNTIVAAAAAGDAADTDRIISLLSSQIAIREYETSIGSDVEYICIGNSKEIKEKDESNNNDDGLSVEAVARLARTLISSSLRTQSRFQTCLLIGGMQQYNGGESDEAIMTPFSSHLQQQVKRASRDFVSSSQSNDAASDAPPTSKSNDDDIKSTLSSSPLSLKPRLYWLDMYGSLQKLQYGAHGMGADFILSILDQGYREDLTREQALDLITSCFSQLKQRYVINSPQPPIIKCIDAHGCHILSTCNEK